MSILHGGLMMRLLSFIQYTHSMLSLSTDNSPYNWTEFLRFSPTKWLNWFCPILFCVLWSLKKVTSNIWLSCCISKQNDEGSKNWTFRGLGWIFRTQGLRYQYYYFLLETLKDLGRWNQLSPLIVFCPNSFQLYYSQHFKLSSRPLG